MQLLFRLISRNLVTNQYSRVAKFSKMKVEDLKLDHLFEKMIQENPGLLFLKQKFNKQGYGIRIAGGAVRDLLCEKLPDDIDLATTATPDQMIELLEKYEKNKIDNTDTESIVRLITSKSGIQHGTVTARIDDKAQYEITTLRIDKITDGRFAEVEFTKDWELDAARRDLTINAMFLDFDGTIYDCFNGVQNLKEKKILFVGDAVERMKEDYLRIMRYFRFFLRYGKINELNDGHDIEVIKAIEKCKHGLESISGPRIWMELKKILSNPNSSTIIKMMFNELELGEFMGFNSAPKQIEQINEIKEIYKNLKKFDDQISQQSTDLNQLTNEDKKLNYLSIIAALLEDEHELFDLRERLHISNLELDTMRQILFYKDKEFNIDLAKREIVKTPKSEKDRKKAALAEVFKYKGDIESYLILKFSKIPIFPSIGHRIKDKIKDKSRISGELDKLMDIWIESDFKMTPDELVAKFDESYDENVIVKKMKK